MYNASSLLLFQNPINRYDIGDRVGPLSLLHMLCTSILQP